MRARKTAIVVAALGVVGVAGAAVAFNTLRSGSAGGAPGTALGAPRFVEEAASAGLSHAYEGGFDYFVGGGVATFDCNDDRLPELYFAGGEAPAALFLNDSEPGGELRFESRQASQPT